MIENTPAFAHGDAVLVVDPQRDFCPGGSLGVTDGDAVIPLINVWVAEAARQGVPVFVSRDWHPPRTTHFAAYGGLWPVHCVAGSPGAEFHPHLRLPDAAQVFSKGMGEHDDHYSAFQSRDERGAELADALAARHVRHVYVLGLATDYCVKATGLDARSLGLTVTVVQAGVRAVNLQPDDGAQALAELVAAGADVL